jgi:site-specific recombinase XerD
MQTLEKSQQIIEFLSDQEADLFMAIEAFLSDKKSQNLSRATLGFYHEKLLRFTEYCEGRAIKSILQITPNDLRQYMLHLEEKGHNPGGCHAAYRTIRAFLNWWEMEVEPDGWKNPIRKTKPPKVDLEPLEPVKFEIAYALLDTCEKGTFYGDRDHAIILMLMDTGLRASEMLSIDLENVNLINGKVTVTKTKSRKFRNVFLGKKTRKALRAFLKHRNSGGPLWILKNGQRLTYAGLRTIIRSRALKAKVNAPSLHSFRRFFALESLRNGIDLMSLQTLLGHADLQVVRRYIKQTDNDIELAHMKSSPVDNQK